jgi:hypothetical protein
MHADQGGGGGGGAGGGADDVNRIIVLLLGRTDAERAAICAAVSGLETGAARCSTEAHRALLLEMIEFGFRGLHDFDVALRERLSDALDAAAAHECARAAAAATATERSISSRDRDRRFRRPSCDTLSGSWRDSSLRSMLSSGRSRSPTVGLSERLRRRSAEEGRFDQVRRQRRSTIDGTQSGLPATLAEPSVTSPCRLRAASEKGNLRASLAREGGAYTPAGAPPPISAQGLRRGSAPARPSRRTLSPLHVPRIDRSHLGQFASAAESAGAALAAAAREDRGPSVGTPPCGRRVPQAQTTPMPYVHEEPRPSRRWARRCRSRGSTRTRRRT